MLNDDIGDHEFVEWVVSYCKDVLLSKSHHWNSYLNEILTECGIPGCAKNIIKSRIEYISLDKLDYKESSPLNIKLDWELMNNRKLVKTIIKRNVKTVYHLPYFGDQHDVFKACYIYKTCESMQSQITDVSNIIRGLISLMHRKCENAAEIIGKIPIDRIKLIHKLLRLTFAKFTTKNMTKLIMYHA